MTYARARLASQYHGAEGAGVSHSAELVRGDFSHREEGPLIRPSGTFSP